MAGNVKFTFEGLCPFFTKHIPEHRLMIGLIGIYEPNEVMHVPTLAIFEEGFPEPTIYRGNSIRKLLTGDVFFHLRSNDSLAADDIVADNSVNLLDIERLYEPGALAVDPQRCQARLHFNHGALSQIESNLVKFVDQHGDLLDRPPERLSYNLKLEIPVPEQSYAVLHFEGETDDFVFKGGRNYRVAITSLPQHIDHDDETNHFQYFYSLAGNTPDTIIIPEQANEEDEGRPFCMLGGFGNTEY